MANIKVIQPEEASGELQNIYEGLKKSRGKIAEVHKIQSLNPQSIKDHMDLYMTVMFGKSPLKRVHREMMAVIVSVANDCPYCQIHHLEAINNFWKDEEKCESLKTDFRSTDLDEKEKALCDYAWNLTKSPGKSTEQEYVRKLKDIGFDDREVLDATLVISYFNFVNRIVLSLGVDLEDDPGGYKYE